MIGGQAVIEGVMMRGVSRMAVAVRTPDGGIDLEVQELSPLGSRYPVLRLPIVRGVVSFVGMLVSGYRTLMHSAEVAGMMDDDEPEKAAPIPAEASVPAEEPVPAEASAPAEVEAAAATAEEPPAAEEKPAKENGKQKKEKSGGKAEEGLGVLAMVAGFVIAIALFTVLPTFIVGKSDAFVHWGGYRTLVEGVIKIAIFVAYLAAVSSMKDIRRVYEYHGAEHKTIACYEHGEELTPENARRYTRFHPRCGTSFLLIVLIVSILVFSLLTWKVLWLRIVLKLLLLPVVVGISYEIIRFVGRHDNSFLRFVLAPGLWLQRLTTREPDDSQLECAIAAIKAVLPREGEDDRW